MTLWTIFQALLMICNGLAILNNDRFLEKYGWGFSQMQSTNSMKMTIIGTIHTAHYCRAFLMVINAVVVLMKLLSG